MGGHDEVGLALVDEHFERLEFNRGPGVGHVNEAVVRVVDGIAVAREVLEGTQHALTVVLVDEPACMADDDLRVDGIAAVVVAHGGAVVVQHIDHGSQVDIHTAFPHFSGDAGRIVTRGVLVIDRA